MSRDEEEALDMIIPKYVTSLFYGALVEAVASENGATYAGDGFCDQQCGRNDQ